MTWPFDQNPNVACVASRSIIDGEPVLVVIHYEDDHSWAFLDGKPFDPAAAKLVAMSTVIGLHPDLTEIAALPPGWSAHRPTQDDPWHKEQDHWAEG